MREFLLLFTIYKIQIQEIWTQHLRKVAYANYTVKVQVALRTTQ